MIKNFLNYGPAATGLVCEILWLLKGGLANGRPAPRIPGFFHVRVYGLGLDSYYIVDLLFLYDEHRRVLYLILFMAPRGPEA